MNEQEQQPGQENDVGHLKSTHKINKVQVPQIDVQDTDCSKGGKDVV